MQGRSIRRSAVGIVSIALVVGATLTAITTAGAHASESSRWVLQNDAGELATRFGSSDTVYVTGAPAGGGLFPSTDVYVVPNADWSHLNGAALHDVTNPQGIPNTEVGFEVAQQPIWFPHLLAGSYDVVFDNDQDGRYTEGVDEVIGFGADPGMTVYYDGDNRHIDKDALKNAFAAPLEHAAAEFHEASLALQVYSTVDSIVNDTSLVAEAGFGIYGLTPFGNDTIDQTAHYAAGIASDGTSHLIAKGSGMQSGVDWGQEQISEAAGNFDKAVAGIVADPPDPNFTTVVPPQRYVDVFATTTPDPLYNSYAKTANDLLDAEAQAKALRHALERADGAGDANDFASVALQLNALATEGGSLEAALLSLQSDASSLGSSLSNLGLGSAPTSATIALLHSTQARVQASGFNATELANFQSHGLTSTQIAALRTALLSIDTSQIPTGESDLLGVLATSSADLAGLQDAVNQAESLAAMIGDNHAPTAVNDSVAVSAGASASFNVLANDSDPDGDTLQVTQTSDPTKGSVTCNANGDCTYTASASASGSDSFQYTVSDPFGATARGTVNLTIAAAPVNHPPTASFDVSPTSGNAPLAITATSTSTDPDGDALSAVWNFGDGTGSFSGSPINHTYTSAGTYTITLTVDDGHGHSASTTRSEAVSPAPNQPPTIGNQHIDVVKTGALDALSTAYDPDQDVVRVVGTSQPQHGTATCTPLGACLYTATPGYTGQDAFTVTIDDGHAHTATATIDESVSAPQDQPSVGVTTTIDVVARSGATATFSTGSSVSQVTFDPAAHGTISCTTPNACSYRSAAGFTGYDGATLHATLADGTNVKGEVHVTVIAAGAGVAPTVTGTANPAPGSGGTAGVGWVVGTATSGGGYPSSAAALVGGDRLTTTIGSGQTIDPTSVNTAPGWSVTPPGATMTATAGTDALLGDSVVQTMPKPQAPVLQGTGGDGHVPILVGNKVFAFFHHSHPTRVTCVDRTTGLVCPGYPMSVNDVGTSDIVGPGVVVGSRIYVHTLAASGYSQSAPVDLFCWDTATNSTCGLVFVARQMRTDNPGASAPVLVNGKVWLAADGGRLYCVDPGTNAACATPSMPDGQPTTQGQYDIQSHNGKIWVSQRSGSVTCTDTATASSCAGWTDPVDLGGWNLITRHDAAGAVSGICVASGGTLRCADDTNSASGAATYPGWVSSEDYYTVTKEAEAGTRTFIPTFSSGLACWDWTTNAACAGPNFQSGQVSQDRDGNSLPSAYGASFDGSCVVGLGDPGLIFTMDPNGNSPCAALSSGTRTTAIDLRSQRCDGTVGRAQWASVTVDATNLTRGTNFSSFVVTVTDAATGATLATQDVVGTNGVVDLHGVSATQHPSLSVNAAAVSTAGNPAWAQGNPPRVVLHWSADPEPLCFSTQLPKCPPTVAPQVQASIAGVTVAGTVPLSAVRCAAVAGPMTGRAYSLAANAFLLGQSAVLIPRTVDTKAVSTIGSVRVAPQCASTPFARIMCADVMTDSAARRSSASAGLLSVNISIPNWPSIPSIQLSSLIANSTTTCEGSSGDVTIAYLKIGTRVVISRPTLIKPNTKLSIGVASIVLNEQIRFNTPDRGLTVNAVHLRVGSPSLTGADIVIGSAESDIGGC